MGLPSPPRARLLARLEGLKLYLDADIARRLAFQKAGGRSATLQALSTREFVRASSRRKGELSGGSRVRLRKNTSPIPTANSPKEKNHVDST